MRPTLLACLILAVGCVDRFPDPDEDLFDDDGQIVRPAILMDATKWTNCDELTLEGTDVGCATSYFAGDFQVQGDSVEGITYWLLIPNPTLYETGNWGDECIIAWEMFGRKGDPVDCGSCDYSVDFDAYVLPRDTRCPQGLYEAEGNNFTQLYNVRERSGNEAIVYFPSGTELGRGESTNRRLWYVSDVRHAFF